VPFTVAGRELRVRASIGLVTAPPSTTTAEQLLQDADMAMYAAKDAGGSRVESFEPLMRREAADRLALLGDLEGVLDRGDLALFHQPLVRLDQGVVEGHEVLLRWRHPQRGVLGPADFLGLAEETGLAPAVGWWVLEEACRALAQRGGDHWVAVNVSVAQLHDPAVVERVLAALSRAGLEPRRLVLEITEQAIAEGPEVVATMRQLRAMGLRLAMDDFGTGYSSLASLAGLPLDVLKIDGSFVARLDTMEGEVLVRAVVDLARALGLRSVAEGVEAPWQLERLREIGCDSAQGYLLGRPAEQPAMESAVPVGAHPAAD
jgi:EAL domain-containing protein (putative c-di-GMP-specific phosphodiesterase class I)